MADASILAIDFSKANTGVAFGRPGEKPVLSSVSFAKWEGATLAETSSAIIRWLPDLLSTYQPSLLVVEAALPPMASRNEISARLALGFDFMVKGAAHLRGIRYEEVHAGTWKSFILGTAHLKTEAAKARAITICRVMGWEPRNGDEADAACIFLWAGATFYKKQCNEALPLLARGQMRQS